MLTQEVAPAKWQSFFTDLSRRFEGWRATLEVYGTTAGTSRVADGLPLQGIGHETEGSEATDVIISLGDRPEAHVTHHVDRPRHVRLIEGRPGAEADVQITSEDGTMTVLRLRNLARLAAAARPTAAGGAFAAVNRAFHDAADGVKANPKPLAIVGGAVAGLAVATLLGLALRRAFKGSSEPRYTVCLCERVRASDLAAYNDRAYKSRLVEFDA